MEQTELKGDFTIPQGYYVTSVSSTRRKVSGADGTEYETEDAKLALSNYSYKSTAFNGQNETVCTGSFSLANNKKLEFGYEYSITINVKKVTGKR